MIGNERRQAEAVSHYTLTTHFDPEIHTFLACFCCVICDLANRTKSRKILEADGFRRRVSAYMGPWHARGQGFKSPILHL